MPKPAWLLLLVLFVPTAISAGAQSPVDPATEPRLNYPDSTAGLEHLAKDIVDAQKKNNGDQASLLLKSLVLPDPAAWYERVFGHRASSIGTYYAQSSAAMVPTLARTFLDLETRNFTQIQAHRFESSCDDNATENTYGLLLARLDPVPLYDLRFLSGDHFVRIFPIAFVDGSFRYLLPLDTKIPEQPGSKDSSAASDAPENSTMRVHTEAKVQAAKLVHTVVPKYPDQARSEHLQGTVTLHAIISKEGTIKDFLSVQGPCSLAQSAVEAVRNWRYRPTLVNAKPVEVDTIIQVIFQFAP
jgi:TonB family protein